MITEMLEIMDIFGMRTAIEIMVLVTLAAALYFRFTDRS